MNPRWYSLDPYTKEPLPIVADGLLAVIARAIALKDNQVALTRLHGLGVSTVFLSLDHSHGRPGGPVLFETMVFGDGNSSWIGQGEHYRTWSEAEAGHERIVSMIDYEVRHWKSPTSRNAREGRYLARRGRSAPCN